jgi:hypothetical protein
MSRKDIEDKARNLKHSGKFDASRTASETPEEQMRVLNQGVRNEKAFGAASECEYCARERRDKNDAQALCRDHLAQALGF